MKFKKDELLHVDRVKVKDRFGLKAGVWLTIMYALIILLVIFFIGFLPGIKNGQKRVTFTSAAGNVSVYVDGTYTGGTPFTAWVKSGEHEVVYKSYSFDLDKQEITVGHPVFFTWLIKRKQSENSDKLLPQNNLNIVQNSFLQNLSKQALIMEYDDSHFYNPIFTNFANLTKATDIAKNTDFFALAFSYISSKEMLNDAEAAANILNINYDFSQQEKLFNSPNYSDISNMTLDSSIKNYAITSINLPEFSLKGFAIDGGTYTLGSNTSTTYPEIVQRARTVTVSPFNIAQSEVTEYQWALFMKANPSWNKDNISELESQGLVDEQYLANISPSILFPSNKAVVNISYKAAEAYCNWLSQISDRNFYLPSEAEWEVAGMEKGADSFQNYLTTTDSLSESLVGYLGSAWEFTSTPFIPLARIMNEKKLDSIYNNYDITGDVIIKGGSYLSKSDDISSATVGTAAQSECSAYTGIRVAWN